MKKQNNKAFTLVELIVVITILAVLATVAFISFQWYTSSSRDSVRLSDLKNISKSFEINRTKGIDFPLPDKKVDISASGTIFQYQWELSQNILKSDLKIFDGGLDPVTKKPYGYAVNFVRNKLQIIWFLENSQTAGNNLFSESLADNTDKYVKTSGDTLGILLDETTNEVIVQSGSMDKIDVSNSSIDYILELWNNSIIKYNQRKLISIQNLQGSCKKILINNPEANSGIFSVKIDWVNNTSVYCDMTTDWGGWTLIVKRIHSSNNIESCEDNLNDFLHNSCNKDILESWNYLDNISYSLWDFGLHMSQWEYMFKQYDSNWLFDEDDAYIIKAKKDIFPNIYDLQHINIESVCSLDKSSCDETDVVWKYIWNNHFNNSSCNGGLSYWYGWNYWYCNDWADNKRWSEYSYYSNGFIWNRNYYNETKLWWHPSLESKGYHELIFVR